GALQDHRGGGGFTDGDPVVLRLTVRDRRKRECPGGVEGRGSRREVVLQDHVRGNDRRGIRRCPGRRVHRTEIRLVFVSAGVDRLEHGQLRNRREARLSKGILGGNRGQRDAIPLEDDVGDRERRAEEQQGNRQ